MEDEEIDAVIIVSPTKYHCEIAVCAANHRKDILLEKPMAMNAQECIQIMDAVKENGVKLQIGFMRRFDASFRPRREAVEAGDIGQVVLVKSLTRGPSTPRPWMYDIKKQRPLSGSQQPRHPIPSAGFPAVNSIMYTRWPATTAVTTRRRNSPIFTTMWY